MQFFPCLLDWFKEKPKPNRFGFLWSDVLLHEEDYNIEKESRFQKFISWATRLENFALVLVTTLFIVTGYNLATYEEASSRVGVLTLWLLFSFFFVGLFALLECRPKYDVVGRWYHKLMSLILPK